MGRKLLVRVWCILFVASAITFCQHAVGQVNAWQSPFSGDWADPGNWSLGIRPGPAQSILITNSGWKAVGIGPNAANNFPDSLNVQSITLSAPTDSFNVLLLNYAGHTPVQAGGVTVQSNAAMTVLSSILLVTNTQNTDIHRVEVGGTVNQGADATVDTAFLSLGNIGPGVYNLTNGTLHGSTEYIGGSFTGLFQQFGGHHIADVLRIRGFPSPEGRYELYDGKLSGEIELYSWGTLHQTGGVLDASVMGVGYYILEGACTPMLPSEASPGSSKPAAPTP